MKKLLVYAIAALSMVACAQEMVPEKEPENNEVIEKVKVSFKASLSQESLSKADINMTDGTGSWEKDDEIAIHTKNGALAILKAESDGAAVTFSGFIDSGDAILDEAVAYYPASIAVEGYGSKVNLPTSYASAAAAAKSFPLRGVIDGGNIEFKHIGALLRITINDIPSAVTSMVFTGTNKGVSGTLNVDATDADAPVCEVGAASSSITVASTSAERGESPAVFYVPVPIGTLSGGFSITLKEGETVKAVRASTNDVTIARAKLLKMKAFDYEDTTLDRWYVPGLYNGWNTTSNPMEAVDGHDGWLVARNITLPNEDTNKGFKFYNNGTWVGGDCSALHKEFSGNTVSNSPNIDFTHGASYDVYYNPTSNKFFLANAGEAWTRTVYMMTDMEMSDLNYFLHVWKHGDASTTLDTWPGVAGTTETISGIKYYKFNLDLNNSPADSYDCIFHTENDSRRYDFRDGKLVLNDNDNAFYLSFTGNKYNYAADGETYGDVVTNPMTQFTDPAEPKGKSNWDVYQGSSLLKYMEWDNGPVLVAKCITVGPSTTDLFFRFNNDDNYYVPTDAGAVSPDTEFNVEYSTGSRPDQKKFTLPSLDGTYVCDFYLDIINLKAKVVPRAPADATITLHFGVPNYGDGVKYYTFNGGTAPDWPGVQLEDFDLYNDVRYYKVKVPGSSYWNSGVKLIIVSNGITYGQTKNFETADWSGYLDDYYFIVVDRDIVQQTEAEATWTFTSSFSGVTWSDQSWLGSKRSGYLADWKVTSDATNLYFLFKIPASGVAASRYIYSGYDTDHDGTTGDNAGGGVNGGYEAMSLLYPFSFDGDNVVCKNGTDDKGYVQTPVGTTVAGVKPVTYGVIRSDYAYVEMMIPRSAIGSPSGTIGIQHSYNWGECGEKDVTLASTE